MLAKALSFSVLSAFASAGGECTLAESQVWIDNMQFTDDIKKCAIRAFGAAPATTDCLADAYNGRVSHACASCFGATVECGKKNCIDECLSDSGAPECLACTERAGCDDALNVCTGFQQGPPKPTAKNAAAQTSSQSTTNGTDASAQQLGSDKSATGIETIAAFAVAAVVLVLH